MKKIIVFFSLIFLATLTCHGQKMNTIESVRTIEKRVAKKIKELSGTIEVSGYQQKSVIQILSKVTQERQVIENSSKGPSQKTEALENLAKKEEYSLRGVLNNQQYDMLIAVLEEQ